MVSATKKETTEQSKQHAANRNSVMPEPHVLNLSYKMLTKIPLSLLSDASQTSEDILIFSAERNKLSELPDQLAEFTSLEKINLSYNCLGTFPKLLCRLECLREIIMIGCAIDSLPVELDNLIYLEKLVLDLNQLTRLGENLVGLYNLTTLSLGMNYFSVFFSNLPFQIRKLNLDNNHLTHFPNVMLDLVNLQHLNLSFNRIKEIPLEIEVLQKLEYFIIVKNRLSSLPSTICNLTKLRVLDISNNHVEVLPGNLSNLEFLEDLNLINNPIIQPPRHICEHGVDAIKAFQDCLKKQLYEPCNRALKLCILGSPGSGKKHVFQYLSGQKVPSTSTSSNKEGGGGKAMPVGMSKGEDSSRRKTFALYETHEWEDLTLTIFKCSGRDQFNIIHQLFFNKNCLFVVCVSMEKFKMSNCKSLLLNWIQLVQSVVPSAMILVLPTFLAKVTRSPLGKLQLEKNTSELRNAAFKYVRNTKTKIQCEIDNLIFRRNSTGFQLSIHQRLKYLNSLSQHTLTLLQPNRKGKKPLIWKIGKSEKCGGDLVHYLKTLTHVEEFFAGKLQDEVQSSWKTLQKLIMSYRKKNSGRLYLNKCDIIEPAVQIGVNSNQIEDVIEWLNTHGVVCIFDRIPHLEQCLFHDPKTLVDIFNAVLDLNLLDEKNTATLQQFNPFELQSARHELRQHGVVSEEILVHLMRHGVPQADCVDFNYFSALLRNLSIARKVDASNIKEVLKSRNARSSTSNYTSTSISKNKSQSFFKIEKNKRKHLMIGRSSSQSDGGNHKNTSFKFKPKSQSKRVVSYSALPAADVFSMPEEDKYYTNKKGKASFFFPWYINQEYCHNNSTQSDDKSKVMTLWPGHMRSSIYKLQVVCVFHDFNYVLAIFHRLSVALHHCLDYRDDWRGRLSATMENFPLLIEVVSFNDGTDTKSCLSILTRAELSFAYNMWAIIIKVVENLQKLLLEYPGLHYQLHLVCPHCSKKLPVDSFEEAHLFSWEDVFFNLKDHGSHQNEFDLDDIVDDDHDHTEERGSLSSLCPHLLSSETAPVSLIYPPLVEFDPMFGRYFSEIQPNLARQNWRPFAKCLGLSDAEIDYIRDSVPDSYNFARQKELLLIFWHRLFLPTASISQLVDACQKQGFTFLVNKLNTLQSKCRLPSVAGTGVALNKGCSFSANQITSSSVTDSVSNVSELDSTFELNEDDNGEEKESEEMRDEEKDAEDEEGGTKEEEEIEFEEEQQPEELEELEEEEEELE